MGGESLTCGERYKLITTEKNVVWPGRQIVYVRQEYLPKICGNWETFYSMWGGNYIDGSEPALMDGIILRLRIRPSDLVVGRNRVWGRNIVTSLMIEDEHPPIVQSWLEEVEKIMKTSERFDHEIKV